MMTNDPNRLLMVIKDRHILISRLEGAVALAKDDNAGDVFKINRLLKHQRLLLKELEDHLKTLIADRKLLDAIHLKNRIKEERAASERIRLEVSLWGLE